MIRNLEAPEVAKLVAADPEVRLLDVRTPEEWEVARIEGAELLTGEAVPEILRSWRRDAPVVLYCHHGVRSLIAARQLGGAGFTDLVNLSGGIEAWSRQVDPSVPRYRILPGGTVVVTTSSRRAEVPR